MTDKTPAAIEPELPPLPCPHCGAEPIDHAIEPHKHALSVGGFKMPDHPGSHVIECPACSAGMIGDTRAAVLASWNRRAAGRAAAEPEWAQELAKLQTEFDKRLRVSIMQGDVIANHVIAMQAAIIEAAQVSPKEGLRWIFNTLRGPGFLPDMDEAAKLGTAQAWFDAKTAEHEAFRAANPGPAEPEAPRMFAVCCGRFECGGECGNEWQGEEAAPTPTASIAPKAEGEAPIDMVLHCPACGLQHIDAPEDAECDGEVAHSLGWSNPPHRSHLCHGCGHIWRPADVPTNGVVAIKTRGKADSPDATPVAQAAAGASLAVRLRRRITTYGYDAEKYGLFDLPLDLLALIDEACTATTPQADADRASGGGV